MALLDGHPQLTVFPEELTFFKNVYRKPNPAESLLLSTPIKNLGLGKTVLQSGERDYADVDYSRIESQIRTLCRENAEQKELLTGTISVWHNAQATRYEEKVRWVEKTPGNELAVPRYDRWFPEEAIFLYILRDPRDNYASYRKRRPELSVQNFCSDWALSVNVGLYLQRFHPRFFIFRYEDLVMAPEKILREICGILKIQWNEIMLIPSRNAKPWHGNSVHGITHNGISKKSVGNYRKNLTKDEISTFETRLYPQLLRFGYKADSRPPLFDRIMRCAQDSLIFLKWRIRTMIT